ncbi:M56 family metallopeptidase [Pedobacter sp. PWIIR3]
MEWLTYLFKVSACMALFYAFYYVFLQKLTFFSTNRYYLLITMIFSFIIPALQIELQTLEHVPLIPMPSPIVYEGTIGNPQISRTEPVQLSPAIVEATYNWEQLTIIIYCSVAVIFLILFLIQIARLLLNTRRKHVSYGKLKVIYKQEGFTNCSFFNYVFVSEPDLTSKEMTVLLQHESIHAFRYHSIDKLFAAFCRVVLWFNPIAYFYEKSLDQVHEYDADYATSLAVGNRSYASLLLSVASGQINLSLVNNFVKSPLKERIKMLFASESNHMKKLMYLTAIPIGLILIWLFAVEVVYAQTKAADPVIKSKTSAQSNKFIQVIESKFANDGSLALTFIVTPPYGQAVKNVAMGGTEIKLIIGGKVYNQKQAMALSPSFLKRLSLVRGDGRGHEFDLPGLSSDDYVVWFGKEPKLTYWEFKNREASKYYTGRTFYGKVVEHFYPENRFQSSGFVVQQDNGVKVLAYVSMEFVKLVNKQMKIGDRVKIKAFNGYFAQGRNYPEVGSGTYSKNGKVIFDRNRFIVDDRPEGVRTNYSTLANIEFKAGDSVRYSKDRKIVDLYGNVKLSLDSIVINADHVNVNNYTKIVTAHKGKISSPYKDVDLSSDLIIYSLNTKKYQLADQADFNKASKRF